MDRGLFPIYYLHLERDTGKKVFLLAGKNLELSARLIAFLTGTLYELRSKAKEEQDIELRHQRRSHRLKPADGRLRRKAQIECIWNDVLHV